MDLHFHGSYVSTYGLPYRYAWHGSVTGMVWQVSLWLPWCDLLCQNKNWKRGWTC